MPKRILIIKSINIPIYIGSNWEFVGWEYLLYKNIPTIICLICLLGSMLCKKRFLNSLKGNKDLPCTIEKIKNANYEYLTFFNYIYNSINLFRSWNYSRLFTAIRIIGTSRAVVY